MTPYSNEISHGDDGHDAYRYANTRPLAVFALALTAAVMAVAVVAAAWSGLAQATESERLADPPDLKSVVETTGAKGRDLMQGVRDDLRDDEDGRSKSAAPSADPAPVR